MGARLDNISAVLGFPYSLFPPTDLSLNLSHIPYSPSPFRISTPRFQPATSA